MKKLMILFILLSTTLYGKEPTYTSIGSFNIQFLKPKKIKQPMVLETIIKIIKRFDIIAIQELQDENYFVISKISKEIHDEYNYIVGPKVGYSKRYKEQYAFFYRTQNVKYVKKYTYEDKLDEFSREPLIVHFKVKETDLVILNIHTPPKFATREIKKLPQVINDAYTKYKIPYIITLGDFNADCSYYKEKKYKETFPENAYIWAIDNDLDTTVKHTVCTYDRIVLTKNMKPMFVSSGVFKFNKILDIPYHKAVQVSDHFPVWVILNIN